MPRLALIPALFLCLGATAALASEPAPRTSCGWLHSQHLSSDSDIGGDVKTEALACAWSGSPGIRHTFELGLLADTPPAGPHNAPAGTARFVDGVPNNQRDTYALYAGFGTSFDYRPNALWGYHLRVGELNGGAADSVRDFWDGVHEAGGIDQSRHSPVSSGSRVLAQLSAHHVSDWVKTEVAGQELGLFGLQAVTAGTQVTAATAGLVLNLKRPTARPLLPNGIAGMGTRLPEANGLYAGVFVQGTRRELATHAMGTERKHTYAKLGANFAVSRSLALGVEWTRPLSDRVKSQFERGYDYVATTVSFRF